MVDVLKATARCSATLHLPLPIRLHNRLPASLLLIRWLQVLLSVIWAISTQLTTIGIIPSILFAFVSAGYARNTAIEDGSGLDMVLSYSNAYLIAFLL